MVKREEKIILPTMKVEAKDDNDVSFQEVQGTIVIIKDVETKFGTKIIMTLNNKKLGDFNVFVNNVSIGKLIKAYSDDDEAWIGKIVDLKKEQDTKFNKDMIVIYPVVA